mmetsp:Transcript_12750/g.38449  ORF Transcript_12750/g.38449 Transcript_12750/m.38449 type:complete len:269 (-) Transcript_12750:20-826(-)
MRMMNVRGGGRGQKKGGRRHSYLLLAVVPLGDGGEGHHAGDVGGDGGVLVEAVGGDVVGDAAGVVAQGREGPAVGEGGRVAAEEVVGLEGLGEIAHEAREFLGDEGFAERLDDGLLLVLVHVGRVAHLLGADADHEARTPRRLQVGAETHHFVDRHALARVRDHRVQRLALLGRQGRVLHDGRRLRELFLVADLQDGHRSELGLGFQLLPLLERHAHVLELDARQHERQPHFLPGALDRKVHELERTLRAHRRHFSHLLLVLVLFFAA